LRFRGDGARAAIGRVIDGNENIKLRNKPAVENKVFRASFAFNSRFQGSEKRQKQAGL
jgi:hypothetical protein